MTELDETKLNTTTQTLPTDAFVSRTPSKDVLLAVEARRQRDVIEEMLRKRREEDSVVGAGRRTTGTQEEPGGRKKEDGVVGGDGAERLPTLLQLQEKGGERERRVVSPRPAIGENRLLVKVKPLLR